MKDMKLVQSEFEATIKQYRVDFRDKLKELLKEAGFLDTDVIQIAGGKRGRLQIVQTSNHFSTQPFEYKFYAYTKDGIRLSLNPSYFWMFYKSDEQILHHLKENFTLVGGADHEAET